MNGALSDFKKTTRLDVGRVCATLGSSQTSTAFVGLWLKTWDQRVRGAQEAKLTGLQEKQADVVALQETRITFDAGVSTRRHAAL